jgi:hypothetical protein
MRWPSAWADPSLLELLKGTPVDFLIMESALTAVAARARQLNLTVSPQAALPTGISLIDGVWPGVKLSQTGAGDRAEAGPTGEPWVDSNGWKVRLELARHPEAQVWIDAPPSEPRLFAESYVTGVCDVAAAGARWVISLDGKLAAEVAARQPEALATWRKIAEAARFFPARQTWGDYRPRSVLGIVSDFQADNEYFSQELLNLVARTNQQYRVIPTPRLSPQFLNGLRAVIYADGQAPAPDTRKSLLDFVDRGGTLIAGPKCADARWPLAKSEVHPRYEIHVLGKGRIAVAKGSFDDPYRTAQDSAVLVSHRYDLLRFWNGGAVSSYLAASADAKRALLQLVFYASARSGSPTVWVAGPYRTARLYTLDRPEPHDIEIEPQQDGLELHFPPVAQYAAVELVA